MSVDKDIFPETMAASEITVTDIPRALFFYTEALGMTVYSQSSHIATIGNDNFRILLKKRLDAGTISGFCFGVRDVDDLCDMLEKENITISKRPFDGPFGREFAFCDPDGNTIRAVRIPFDEFTSD